MKHISMTAKVSMLAVLMTMTAGIAGAQQCGTHMVQGKYSFYYTGGIPGTVPPYAGIGVLTIYGSGKGASTETTSNNGTILRAKSAVVYTVNSDCTGTITWDYTDYGLIVHGEIVIADNGKTIYTIGTDNGSLSYGVYTRLQ